MRKTTKTDKAQALSEVMICRIKDAIFLLLCVLSLFILVSLLSYNAEDPGWSRASAGGNIHNLSGALGACFADVLLCFFGQVAFLLPLLIAGSGIALYKNARSISPRKLLWSIYVVGFFCILAGSCALVNLIFAQWPSSSMPGPNGGIIGSLITNWLLPRFNTLGSGLMLTAVLLFGLTINTNMSWLRIMELFGRLVIELLSCAMRGLAYGGKLLLSSFARKKLVQQELRRTEPVVQRERPVPAASQRPDPALEFISSQPRRVIAEPKARAMPAAPKRIAANAKLPDLNLLEPAEASDPRKHYSKSALENLSREVEERLLDFGVEVKVVAVCPGPIITRFEMTLAPGLKVSKITGLAKDLARSLSVTSVRVVEVIPGKAVVGLEIPNKHREMVKLREVLEAPQYQEQESPLSIALGKDISGIPVVVNLGKMPHLLVAGTTGSGKSVGVNAMLLSLLFKATPSDLRLILIDPKMLELSVYDGIGHLLTPVVTDMNDAANALRWCVAEMERRYQLMAAVGVRNLAGFNAKVMQAQKDAKPLKDPLWSSEQAGGSPPNLETLPYIVVIIDEFADMMMVVGKKVEELIARIAQKARAAGIHMILATQRPSVDVITGLIKANVPTRIAFQVSSRIDSRTILDQQGAEQLLGHGDMLYLAPGTGIPTRVHGAFVSDEEVHSVVSAIKQAGPPPQYMEEISLSSGIPVPGIDPIDSGGEQDPVYDEAVAIVIETRKASISYLQRRLKIGYNRSARLIEAMEAAGVVSEMLGNGSREVLAFDVGKG